MILASHGIIGSSIVQAFDLDAQDFFDRVDTAGGSLSLTEKNAVNTLVIKMKTDGIWSGMKAIYPMVGASAAACAQNLKSSTFTGTFNGGWTFASTGIKPNGSTGFMNTNLIPNVDLTQNSNHLSFYSRTSNAVSTTIEIGSLNTSPASYFHSHIYYSDGVNVNRYFMLLAQSTAPSVANANSLGFFNGNRKNSTTVSHFKNGSNIGDLTSTSVALNNRAVYIGAGNINGSASNFSSRECAFASIGEGLTDIEASDFYDAVQAFQTTLSRNV
jgi:hypothetical protein